MNSTKHLELSIKTLVATLFLGLLANQLLGTVPWGIGFTLYSLVILLAGTYLYRNRVQPIHRDALLLIPPILLFASLFAWRDASALKFLNGVCLFLLTGALSLRARSGDLTVGSILDYPFRLLGRWIEHLADFFILLSLEGKWGDATSGKGGTVFRSILKGSLIAAPILLVFAGLLSSADAVYSRFLVDLVTLDTDTLFTSSMVFALSAWLIGGFFRRLFLAAAPEAQPAAKQTPKLSPLEIGIVLGTINLLFLSFVIVQFRYLFGGTETIFASTGLTYAQYARKGFFELVTVVGLALPVLLATHAVLKEHSQVYTWHAVTMVGLLFVIMASAVVRMALYVDAYGISQLRIYVLAIMVWLASSLAWFVPTVLRGRADRYAFGTLCSGLAVVFLLNVSNPDGIVAKVNTQSEERPVDIGYLASLSADATPILVESLPRLRADQATVLRQALLSAAESRQSQSWTERSLATLSADRAVASLAR